MHYANILPGRGLFRCTDPSNHARRANLAIRRRRTARAIASTAPPLWRGSLPRDGRTGRGRFLVGRGGAAEGVRGVVGCRALTEKPASAKRRLWIPGTSNFSMCCPTLSILSFKHKYSARKSATRKSPPNNSPKDAGLLSSCGAAVSPRGGLRVSDTNYPLQRDGRTRWAIRIA